MKTAEIRERNTEELEGLQKDLVRELWKARFDNHTQQLTDPSQIGKLRRRIARVKTILTERRNATQEQA